MPNIPFEVLLQMFTPPNEPSPDFGSDTQPQPPKLLIIEDDIVFRKMLMRYVSRVGWEATCAESYQQGLAMFGVGRYDCIVVDLILPGGRGSDLIEEFRRLDRITPIVAMTGAVDSTDIVRAVRFGVSAYLNKPFALADFADLITALVEGR